MIYDLIDKIYKPTGVMLVGEDGIEYPEMEQVQGYHVNVLPPLNDTIDEDGNTVVNPLKQYIITPEQPVRKFAGRGGTICLMFKDRDEWLSMGIEKTEEEMIDG